MTPALTVRPLARGEEDLWYAVRPHPRGVAPRFTEMPDFDPSARLLAFVDGVPVGRLYLIVELPHAVLLLDPDVADGRDAPPVAGALVAAGRAAARDLGVRETNLLLQSASPRTAELLTLTESWGFVPQRTKYLFRVFAEQVRWDAAALPEGHAFRPVAGVDDPLLVATLKRVLEGSFEADEDAVSIVSYCADRCRNDGCLHPEDWQLVEHDGRPVGVVIPAFSDASHVVATNLWVGLVPEARGRGLGVPLQLRGLATLRERGAKAFIGSCDVRNAAMQRVFERLGYARAMTQNYFTLRAG